MLVKLIKYHADEHMQSKILVLEVFRFGRSYNYRINHEVNFRDEGFISQIVVFKAV